MHSLTKSIHEFIHPLFLETDLSNHSTPLQKRGAGISSIHPSIESVDSTAPLPSSSCIAPHPHIISIMTLTCMYVCMYAATHTTSHHTTRLKEKAETHVDRQDDRQTTDN